mmetsp:Transcript_96110/g.256869  ORF Transcript_96110/g.256869 Transcript_96110/m.256869 type:complete len:436 (+) Transcript_96110:515-1822(+)
MPRKTGALLPLILRVRVIVNHFIRQPAGKRHTNRAKKEPAGLTLLHLRPNRYLQPAEHAGHVRLPRGDLLRPGAHAADLTVRRQRMLTARLLAVSANLRASCEGPLSDTAPAERRLASRTPPPRLRGQLATAGAAGPELAVHTWGMDGCLDGGGGRHIRCTVLWVDEPHHVCATRRKRLAKLRRIQRALHNSGALLYLLRGPKLQLLEHLQTNCALVDAPAFEFPDVMRDGPSCRLIGLVVQVGQVRVLQRLLDIRPVIRIKLQHLCQKTGSHLVDGLRGLGQGPVPVSHLRRQVRVLSTDPPDELADIVRSDSVNELLVRDANVLHDASQLLARVRPFPKWTCELQLSKDTTHRPYIHFVAVPLERQQDLRRPVPSCAHILGHGTQLREGPGSELDPGQSKITDLEITVAVDQEIPRLDIPMHNTSTVQPLQPA